MPVEIIELPPSTLAPQQPQQPQSRTTKLYLATPCYGCQMTVMFMASVLSLQSACVERGIELMVDFVGNESLVERARNILLARFLASDATHLLFIDADIGFRPDAVMRLLAADKDVATGVYPKKAFDWSQIKTKLASKDDASKEPVHSMGLDYNINIANHSEPITNGFVKVLDSATGFMLIKRAVLQRMAEHYRAELHCVNDIPGQSIKDYVALFACLIDPNTRRFLSEDYSFCRRYQALGGEIWADMASPLVHLGTSVFTGDVVQRFFADQKV